MSEELANTVYLGGIPEDVTVEQIKHLFITFGEIKSVDLPIDSETCIINHMKKKTEDLLL